MQMRKRITERADPCGAPLSVQRNVTVHFQSMITVTRCPSVDELSRPRQPTFTVKKALETRKRNVQCWNHIFRPTASAILVKRA